MARLLRVVGAVGAITRLFSAAFLVPVIVALVYDPRDLAVGPWMLPSGAFVFAFCAGSTYVLAAMMQRLAAGATSSDLRDRESYLTVGLGWLWLCLLAMLPFMLTGALTSPVDAFFEAMSGLTTTGATVIVDLDVLAPSVLLWRAFLQFLGGMGIVVLSVAIIARLTQGGLQMIQAEAPGPSVERLAPRLAQTARILWTVYLAFSAVLFILVALVLHYHGFAFKQAIFESLIHTFTTISTGGFSSHNASIAYFDDWLLEATLIVFMLVSGTNYTLHYQMFKGRSSVVWRDPEFRFFLTTYVSATVVLTAFLWHGGASILQALRDSAFTAASLITSTGFGTADFDAWPSAAKILLVLLMATGATAGSTGGGLKHVRVLVIMKMVKRQFVQTFHPHAVVPLRLGNRVIQPATAMAVAGFFIVFLAAWSIGTFVLLLFDPHFTTPLDAASASVSALSNMGPGFGVVGPTRTYAGLTAISKLTLALEMWFGRLELFTAILVFTPETWRH